MKIKKLDICGFKSFVDPTVLSFEQDITCVVGPNGCGKSNIADAIRWVMGEQSIKTLRGKAMEDVIFNGAESRGPHGMAEVSVTFDNSDGLAPPEYQDYSEITVTRRLDRSGASDYIINKTPVRLMDVTNLFLGTGVGRKAYSIIEQGRVGLVVSAKPEDRRQMIEEAAGISKFKAKKRAAETKMERTRENLLRVGDIIAEIEKNLASLKRQARKAERYKEYRHEILDLELWIASHRWLELTGAHRVLREEIENLSVQVEDFRAALRTRETEAEADRLAVSEIEIVLDKAQTRAYGLDNEVKLLESEVSHHLAQIPGLGEREAAAKREAEELGQQRHSTLAEAAALRARLEGLEEIEYNQEQALQRENGELERRRRAAEEAEGALRGARARVSEAQTRIARAETVFGGVQKRRGDHTARAERLERDRETLEVRLTEARQNAEEVSARYRGLCGGKEEIASRKGQIEAELEQLRQEIRVSDGQVDTLRIEHGKKRSRLHSLEEIQRRFEGVGSGVRTVMGRFAGKSDESAPGRVLGLVADLLECPAELTQALAAALGERLQYVVVDELAMGLRAIGYLKEVKRGRATFIPKMPLGVRAERVQAAALEGAVGYLIDSVSAPAEYRSLAEYLLGDVLVVKDMESAQTLRQGGQTQALLVTLAGELLGPEGRLTGGEGEDAGAHLLQVKREIRELGEAVEQLDGALQEAVEHHGKLRQSIAQSQAELEATRGDAHQKEIALVEASRDLKRAQEAGKETSERIARLADEADELARALQEADQEEANATQERKAAERALTAAQEAVVDAEDIYQTKRVSVDEQNAVVTEVRVKTAQAKQQAEADRLALERLERSQQELQNRVERLQRDAGKFAQQQQELTAQVACDRETLAGRVQEALAAAEQVAQARARHDQAREGLAIHDAALRQMRASIDEASGKSGALAIKEREVAMETAHLLEGIAQRYRLDLKRELGDYHDREIPGEAVRTRIDELQRVVERMGEINLTAIEEYEERAARYETLTAQRKDLDSALEQLEQAIRRMNRESKRMFREAYEAINSRFQQIFPRVFGGGKAELGLTNPDDLLESGVEIMAMPPGKKIGSIELMSGGEKALTAISLIFAIFQYKPSPFCLLDEVDAPLDEANIGRFCDLVREMTSQSQFIMITHAKRTMMTGDVLYGVTMETPGISKLVSVVMRDYADKTPTTDYSQTAAVA
jgi:chromosome segregation protein